MRASIAVFVVLATCLASTRSRSQEDCASEPHESWRQRIVFPDDGFAASSASGPRWVKFTILACDPDRVYFQDCGLYPFHHDFARERLAPLLGVGRDRFDELTLDPATQVAVLGAVIFPPERVEQPGDLGIQLVGRSPYPATRVIELFHRVRSAIEAEGATAYYFPTFEQQAAARADEEALREGGVPLGSSDRWAEGNAVYAPGWALGRLRFVTASEIDGAWLSGALGADDVLLTDGVPAEIPHVAGILSLAPATPNSHVAILARGYGVPFAHLTLETDAERALELVGRRVVLTAYETYEGTELRIHDVDGRLTEEQVAEILARKDPPPLDLAVPATAGARAIPVRELEPTDIDIVGGKAANYSLLLRAIPDHARKATALSFDLWSEFLAQRVSTGLTLEAEIRARLAPHDAYPPADLAELAATLEGIRDLIRDPDETSFDPEARSAVIAALEDPSLGFDPGRKLRFRSSTNFEDSRQFTGAGLFDSRSGCLLDELDADETGPSLCDPERDSEQGVFRAIRRVFASLYKDGAYVERLRWRVAEEDVAMGVLVHHSFPDDTELANGVATLSRLGPNDYIDMVTQTGATSVANPSDGSVPETVRVTVLRSGIIVEAVEGSNLLPLGDHVLAWRSEYERFGALFSSVADQFAEETGRTRFVLDFEYKKIAPEDELIVKQVRELPTPDGTASLTPFFLDQEAVLGTFQGEAADVFSNHRLKSTWRLRTGSFWLTEENLRAGLFRHIELDASDGCESFRIEGDPASLPGARVSYEDGTAVVGFDVDTIPNPRRYELAATFHRRLVSPAESPFWTLEDAFVWVRARYERPVLGWNELDQDVGPKSEEVIILGPPVEPRDGDLLQVRSLARDGVELTTRFFWPPPPGGIVAGYTAPLVRWQETRIEGLTSDPITLTGDRSQTYRPGHHNFSEQYLFSPHDDPGVSDEILSELDALDIRWIHVQLGIHPERLETFGACDLALACACAPVIPPFIRGDCSGDGSTSGVTDALVLLGYNFLGKEKPPCIAACDANRDGRITGVTDAVYVLHYNFLGGPPPPAPFPECGPASAPSDEDLGCVEAPTCP